jgi:predicted Rdx family selenoprotein
MPLWIQILVLVSTLAGLLFAGSAVWIEFKEKQAQLNKSTSELEDTVAAQQKELQAAKRRIQNLETIVTSQAWDMVHDEGVPEADKKRSLSQASVDLKDPEDDLSDAERATRLARRLKT